MVDDETADELYALAPQEFVAARDARARAAKAAGDAAAAAAIKALRRPTAAAWLANQLVRRHRDEVEPLLELGAALREATATLRGPDLRALSRQRTAVVQALVRQARRLAAEAAQPVSEDAVRGLEDTLNAALADEGAAERLRGGRLTEPLRHTGFGPSDAPASAATRRSAVATPREEPGEAETGRAARRAALERELAEAWTTARTAADLRAAAEAAAAETSVTAQRARQRVRELAEGLDRARTELEAAEHELAERTQTRDAARAAAEEATDRVRSLQDEISST